LAAAAGVGPLVSLAQAACADGRRPEIVAPNLIKIKTADLVFQHHASATREHIDANGDHRCYDYRGCFRDICRDFVLGRHAHA
jgi:hypothetical protein